MRLALCTLFACQVSFAAAADVRGAGATFPSDVYNRWAVAYAKERGGKVEYLPTGSGDGLKRIMSREVDFGASDSPLSSADLYKHKLVQFPTAVGGVVPVVNVKGIGSRQLRLSGEVLADIMGGAIVQWNDRRIAALNSDLTLPAIPIVRVVRAESSGTTEAFSAYLSAVSPAWKTSVGQGPTVKWPNSPVAVQGNDAVVKALRDTAGAIGYVSYDRVMQYRLSDVRLQNRAGHFVAASEESFKAAVLESDLSAQGDETATLLDRPGPLSWPITIVTYVLVDAQPKTAERARPALQFLYWSYLNGDKLIRLSGFAPLPMVVQSRLMQRFQMIRPQDGQPLNFYSH
jgi:phosphate transport system substrate-binding protein